MFRSTVVSCCYSVSLVSGKGLKRSKKLLILTMADEKTDNVSNVAKMSWNSSFFLRRTSFKPISRSSTFNQIFKTLSSTSASTPDTELIVPGVNRPLSHIIHVLFAIIISVVLHEIGHALACIAEGGSINHVGVLSFAVLPGAFVSMDLERVPNWGRVRIFCAGIWHNLLICAFCLLLRHEEMNLTNVLFEKDQGLSVTYIDSSSSISGIAANSSYFSTRSFDFLTNYC